MMSQFLSEPKYTAKLIFFVTQYKIDNALALLRKFHNEINIILIILIIDCKLDVASLTKKNPSIYD